MSFLDESELSQLGLHSLGNGVQISTKASIVTPGSISIGDNSRIDDFVVLSGNVNVGRNVHISALCSIIGGTIGVEFGDYSTLSFGSHIFAKSDDFSGEWMTNPTIPLELRRVDERAVQIARHAILGANTIVFPGVSVSEGSAIGAGSLVKYSTEPWRIYAGNPLRQIGERSRQLVELEFLD